MAQSFLEPLEVTILAAIPKLLKVEGFVEVNTLQDLFEYLLLMLLYFFRSMLLAITVKSILLSVKLFLDALDVALAQTDTTVATHLITQEADIAICIIVAIVPSERQMRLDLPEMLPIAHRLEVVIMQTVTFERIGIFLQQTTAFVIVGMQENHVIAEADKEPVGIVLFA